MRQAESQVPGHGKAPLPQNALHVWHIDLSNSHWDTYAEVLNPSEVERFNRVVLESARNYWRRSRIALRIVLAQYLNSSPDAISLQRGPRGKPVLAESAVALFFNVSHSHERALIAVSSAEIGVDIERMSDSDDILQLLESITAANEHMPHDTRASAINSAFYRRWTHKEAYCKAIGQGLYKPMHSFSIQATTRPEVFRVQDAAAQGDAAWSVYDLPCEPGWMACVCSAIPQPDITVRIFQPPLPG